MEQKGTLPSLKKFRNQPGFNWPSEQLQMELMKPPTIAQKYTELEVAEKLQKAFEGRGLKDVNFEFAITSSVNVLSYELKSKNFTNEIEDQDNNLILYYIFMPPSGSDLENLVPEEVMTVVVPDWKKMSAEMRWFIVGAVFFTLMIIATFYVTV